MLRTTCWSGLKLSAVSFTRSKFICTAASARTRPGPRLCSSISSTARDRRSSVGRRNSSAVCTTASSPVGCPARASKLPRLSMMAMPCGLRPGTAAATRFSTACTPCVVQPRRAGHGQHHAGLRLLQLARERLALRQHQMHRAPRTPCSMRMLRASSPSMRAGFVDVLLELRWTSWRRRGRRSRSRSSRLTAGHPWPAEGAPARRRQRGR